MNFMSDWVGNKAPSQREIALALCNFRLRSVQRVPALALSLIRDLFIHLRQIQKSANANVTMKQQQQRGIAIKDRPLFNALYRSASNEFGP